MSSQRAFFKIIFSVVALVLMLHISFSLISASPAEAAEATPEEGRTEELIRQVDTLTALVEQLINQDEHVLLLQIRDQTLGGAITLHSNTIRIAVDPRFFNSCSKGDDITDSPWVQNLSDSLVGESRIFVVDKFTVSH